MTAQIVTVERVDLPAAPDDVVNAVAEIERAVDHELVPEDPPAPLDITAERLRVVAPHVERVDWVARSGGHIVGRGNRRRMRASENQHIRDVRIVVGAGDRRRGVGSALLAEMIRDLDDGLLLHAWTNDRLAAAGAFARYARFDVALTAALSQLDLATLDRALVADWGSLDPAGYRLAWIDADVPDALMANVISAYDAMNDEPHGELAVEPWRTTVEQVRGWDELRRRTKRERRLAIVIEVATGESAGYTETSWDPAYPHVVFQQGTAVLRAHRGKGLGKWAKAAMLARILAERPGLRYVRTGNATTNEPMLAINTKLGFRKAWSDTIWQAKVPAVRGALSAR